MTTDAELSAELKELLRPPPKRPRIGPLIAVSLELSMVATFVVERSKTGLLLALAYGWFSATWAMLRGAFDADS